MKHNKNCNWEKSNCEYKKTHHYCPHKEHACNCKDLEPKDNSMNQTEKELIEKFEAFYKSRVKGGGFEYPAGHDIKMMGKFFIKEIRNAVGEREKEIVKGIMDQRISFVGKDLYLEGYHKAINNILKLMSKEILSKMGIALKGQKEDK